MPAAWIADGEACDHDGGCSRSYFRIVRMFRWQVIPASLVGCGDEGCKDEKFVIVLDSYPAARGKRRHLHDLIYLFCIDMSIASPLPDLPHFHL
jgi:hypothetical protein